MAQQSLQLDHVSTGLQARGGEGVAQGVDQGPGRHAATTARPDVGAAR
jgi:hypothetical protein